MSSSSLTLAPRLDYATVSDLHRDLLEHVGADLELDASQVMHFGALGVQTIRAAARSWAEAGHRLTMTGASNDIADQLHLLGFTPATLTGWELST